MGLKADVSEFGDIPKHHKVKKYSFNMTFLTVFGDKIVISIKFDP